VTRDFIYSLILHAGVIGLTFLTSPFEIKGHDNYDEVIQVSLLSAPPASSAPAESTPVPPEPVAVTTPPPVEEEEEDIPVGKPETEDKAEITPEEKPPEEEKPPPPKENVVQQQQQAATEGSGDDESAVIHSPATAGSSPFAGATINNASFDYPYWFTQAFNKVRSHWRNPVSSDAPLICTIYFEVIKSGRVIVARVEQSSGVPIFDEACLQAVNQSAPFPPLPRQFADEVIGITLPFKGVPGS